MVKGRKRVVERWKGVKKRKVEAADLQICRSIGAHDFTEIFYELLYSLTNATASENE